MADTQQRTYLVAGGTGNVGRHIVQAQLDVGAAVVVPSRDPRRLDALAGFLDLDRPGRFVPVAGDLSDGADAARVLGGAGPLDGAVASLGGFVPAPSVLEAPESHLERALRGYVFAHLAVARAVVPHLRERGGAYLMINGPLAYAPLFPGTGLVSIATAAQAMLARVLMSEAADTRLRINELVIHSSFGWGNDEANVVTGADIGRYIAHLLSPAGSEIRDRSIHMTPDEVGTVPGGRGVERAGTTR